jgi:hypothetical protein
MQQGMYHCSVKSVSRSQGRSATAAAAYRSAERITDERTGEIHDYTRKRGVVHSELVLPEGVSFEREQLWNKAEAAEHRKDSKVAREWELALPHELDKNAQIELAREFAGKLVERYGVAVDICIHEPHRQGDERNVHAHLLTTTRQVTPEGLTSKTRELDSPKTSGAELDTMRGLWADCCNRAYEREGLNIRTDHRTLAEQGIDREATIHLGPTATAIERRGNESRLAAINADIAEYNQQLETITSAQKEIAEINKLLSEMQISTPEEKAIEQPAEIVQKLPEFDKEKQQKKEQEDALLKEAGLYGKTAREANGRLYQAQEQLHSADVSLFHAKQEQQKHNHEFDNMGFFKRNLHANSLNERAKMIDKKIELCTADYARKQEAVTRLEKAHSILETREREAREQYAQTPQGKMEAAAHERQREEMRKRIQERLERSKDRERGGR